jgi:hypothetical protein
MFFWWFTHIIFIIYLSKKKNPIHFLLLDSLDIIIYFIIFSQSIENFFLFSVYFQLYYARISNKIIKNKLE